MIKILPRAFCYDDVLLVPRFSPVRSRSSVDVSTQLGPLSLRVPICSANMDTITDAKMAEAMHAAGGLGILHRYAPFDVVEGWVTKLKKAGALAIPSVGVKPQDFEAARKYLHAGADAICLDIAHADSQHAIEQVASLRHMGYNTIIAGNVATATGAQRLVRAGASIIKVGVGSGAVCTTRLVTGHGYPQLSAVIEVVDAVKNLLEPVYVIADGGVRTSGDIVKALAAGADAVMLGRLLAGCDENPGTHLDALRLYRGMASEEAQRDYRGAVSNSTAEGVSTPVMTQGPVAAVLEKLVGGLRSGLSYSGANSLSELRALAQFVEVTSNTVIENGPHGATRKV